MSFHRRAEWEKIHSYVSHLHLILWAMSIINTMICIFVCFCFLLFRFFNFASIDIALFSFDGTHDFYVRSWAHLLIKAKPWFLMYSINFYWNRSQEPIQPDGKNPTKKMFQNNCVQKIKSLNELKFVHQKHETHFTRFFGRCSPAFCFCIQNDKGYQFIWLVILSELSPCSG